MSLRLRLWYIICYCLETCVSKMPDHLEKEVREILSTDTLRCLPDLSVDIINRIFCGHKCVSDGLNPEEDYDELTDMFILAAFKTLRYEQNGLSKKLFSKLRDLLGVPDDFFIISEKLHTKRNGFTTITLNISNLDAFLEHYDWDKDRLESGFTISP